MYVCVYLNRILSISRSVARGLQSPNCHTNTVSVEVMCREVKRLSEHTVYDCKEEEDRKLTFMIQDRRTVKRGVFFLWAALLFIITPGQNVHQCFILKVQFLLHSRIAGINLFVHSRVSSEDETINCNAVMKKRRLHSWKWFDQLCRDRFNAHTEMFTEFKYESWTTDNVLQTV